MSCKPEELDKLEVAEILENFLRASGSPWEWDDFITGMTLRDPALEAIRQRCVCLGREFPPVSPHMYCGEEGLKVIESYINELRKTR